MPYKRPTNASQRKSLQALLARFMKQLHDLSEERQIKTKAGHIRYQEFYPSQSKSIIDEIDKTLGCHYCFTDDELDYIINYDIKYRIRAGNKDEDEE